MKGIRMTNQVSELNLQSNNIRIDIRGIAASVCFAAFVAFCVFLGTTSQLTIGLTFKEAGLLACPFFIGSASLFYVAYNYLMKRRMKAAFAPARSKDWVAAFVILSLIWGANWLIFQPGYWTADSVSSLEQALGQQDLSSQHPIVFTALVALFVNLGNALGSLEAGMAAFTLFTMVFFSACCSYFCAWAYSRTRSLWVFTGTLLFFTLNIP